MVFISSFSVKQIAYKSDKNTHSQSCKLRVLQQTCWYLSIQPIAPPPFLRPDICLSKLIAKQLLLKYQQTAVNVIPIP